MSSNTHALTRTQPFTQIHQYARRALSFFLSLSVGLCILFVLALLLLCVFFALQHWQSNLCDKERNFPPKLHVRTMHFYFKSHGSPKQNMKLLIRMFGGPVELQSRLYFNVGCALYLVLFAFCFDGGRCGSACSSSSSSSYPSQSLTTYPRVCFTRPSCVSQDIFPFGLAWERLFLHFFLTRISPRSQPNIL